MKKSELCIPDLLTVAKRGEAPAARSGIDTEKNEIVRKTFAQTSSSTPSAVLVSLV